MNSKECVKRAIHFKNPAWLPIAHHILPATYLKYGKILEEILPLKMDDFGQQVCRHLTSDQLPLSLKKGLFRDPFGTVWQITEDGLAGVPVDFPLKNWSDLKNYHWPDPEVEVEHICSGTKDENLTRFYQRRSAISIFERLANLRGWQNLLTDLKRHEKKLQVLIEALIEFYSKWLEKALQKPCDGILIVDDWGSQQGLLIPIELWQRYFKEPYRKLITLIKSKGLDVHFHSDGNIFELIPHLIDLGIDVLHCQVALMGAERMGRHFKDSICIQTGFDEQHVLPFANPKKLRMHIFHVLQNLMSPRGGLIASAEIGPWVPLENIQTIYQTLVEFGRT